MRATRTPRRWSRTSTRTTGSSGRAARASAGATTREALAGAASAAPTSRRWAPPPRHPRPQPWASVASARAAGLLSAGFRRCLGQTRSVQRRPHPCGARSRAPPALRPRRTCPWSRSAGCPSCRRSRAPLDLQGRPSAWRRAHRRAPSHPRPSPAASRAASWAARAARPRPAWTSRGSTCHRPRIPCQPPAARSGPSWAPPCPGWGRRNFRHGRSLAALRSRAPARA
mmetsp:Transcript_25709/g.76723  ORF Transcript_25709/g.76723 Transcript_25709/m.76723 type:complete len:227 (+) Transcript_25709:1258-1938(+)